MDLIIATFNLQNKLKFSKYSDKDKKHDYPSNLKKLISTYKIDILCVQELTKLYQNRLVDIINNKYKLVGDYRFSKLGSHIPLIRKFNESTAIISKWDILYTETKHIPSFYSIPRVITEALISIHDREIKVFNTHLEVLFPKIKQKQLNWVLKLLETETKEFILMGDFNSTVADYYFKDFINRLDKIGYKRVEINEQTHKSLELGIDHIFIPKHWKVKSINVINMENKISDHRPVIVTVSL